MCHYDVCFLSSSFKTKGRHANANAHAAVDHMTSFLLGEKEISQPEFELPTSSLKFGYLSTIIR